MEKTFRGKVNNLENASGITNGGEGEGAKCMSLKVVHARWQRMRQG